GRRPRRWKPGKPEVAERDGRPGGDGEPRHGLSRSGDTKRDRHRLSGREIPNQQRLPAVGGDPEPASAAQAARDGGEDERREMREVGPEYGVLDPVRDDLRVAHAPTGGNANRRRPGGLRRDLLVRGPRGGRPPAERPQVGEVLVPEGRARPRGRA